MDRLDFRLKELVRPLGGIVQESDTIVGEVAQLIDHGVAMQDQLDAITNLMDRTGFGASSLPERVHLLLNAYEKVLEMNLQLKEKQEKHDKILSNLEELLT